MALDSVAATKKRWAAVRAGQGGPPVYLQRGGVPRATRRLVLDLPKLSEVETEPFPRAMADLDGVAGANATLLDGTGRAPGVVAINVGVPG